MKKSQNLIKNGEMFKLGDHLLLCADSRDKEMISKLVGNIKIKILLSLFILSCLY
jgi:hypothetical protein